MAALMSVLVFFIMNVLVHMLLAIMLMSMFMLIVCMATHL
jgi:hypothetical protein